MTTDPKELLAAYASGDVSDEERRLVDDYLESEPGAKGELAATRALLNEVRAAEPMPAQMPDFEALAASTMQEIARSRAAEQSAPATTSWLRTGAFTAGLAAAVLAIVFLVIRPGGEDDIAATGSDAGAAVARTHNPDSVELQAELPSAEWLLPRPEPQLATAESLDVLADDWMIGDVSEDDVVLEDLDVAELQAIDEALASL